MKQALLITPKSHSVPTLEDVDYIAVDAGALLILQAGLPIQFAVGDFDSMSEEDYAYVCSQTRVYKHPIEKNETDSELALRLAKEQGYTNIVLWGAISGRLDHTIINLGLMMYRDDSLVLMDENQKITLLEKGRYTLAARYQHVSFFALEAGEISLENFKYPLEHRKVTCSDLYLSSNSFLGKEGIVTVHSGKFLCVESNLK